MSTTSPATKRGQVRGPVRGALARVAFGRAVVAVAILSCLAERYAPMGSRLTIALLGLLPAPLLLGGCHHRAPAAQASDSPSPNALAAVSADAGAPRDELARRIDALFTGPEMGETRALIVMHAGRIVAERYGAPYTRRTRLIGWSMSKTLTGELIGMLVADGKLKLDA